MDRDGLSVIAVQIRLRLALLRAVFRSLDRSRQIVFLFIAVVLGQFTVTDPALWLAPLRPLLLAPLASSTGFLPCLVIALAAVGVGIATRPVFEWRPHSRYLAHVGARRAATMAGDAIMTALLALPFAAMMTAGYLRSRLVDPSGPAVLLLFSLLLAAWMRIAARSSSLATAVLGASVACVVVLGTRAAGPSIVLVAALATAAVLLVARARSRRRAAVDERPWWSTRSPLTNLWLQLHVDAVRALSPWMFVPTVVLAAITVTALDRRAGSSDVVLMIVGLLLLWQLVATAKMTTRVMHGWRRSRVLAQLPTRGADRLLRIVLSSALLFVLATPAEAMSLHASGNSAGYGWASLAVAAPWIVLWSQSRVHLRGVLAWAAIAGVTWIGVA